MRTFEKRAEKKGYRRIAGVDEAGRGPLAGPVVSAAVILPKGFRTEGIQDSKKLTPGQRAHHYGRIYRRSVTIGIGIVDPGEIDRINILRAALLSMAMAVENLHPRPDYLLVDGPYPAPVPIDQEPVPHGDGLSLSVAAASIVAKVTRDRLMERYDVDYPQFGFREHKGYATRIHRTAILRFGCCPIHRRTFHGVKEYLKD